MSQSGSQRLIAEWKERPFHAHGKRHVTVEHRIIANTYPGVGCDIRHEVRAQDYGPTDGWTAAEVYEIREHGVDVVESDNRWWSS